MPDRPTNRPFKADLDHDPARPGKTVPSETPRPESTGPEIDEDDRSAVARGMSLSFQVLALAMSGAVPGLVGFWIDQKIGTRFLLLIVGLIVGFALMAYQLIYLVRRLAPKDKRRRPPGM